jgi:hypothetical protein
VPVRALRAFLLTLCVLSLWGAAPAAADDGRPSRTVVRTADRAAPRSSKELVILVGGYAGMTSDGTFDVLIAGLWGDPRYEIRRFGALPEFPYDTTGALDANAASLTAEIRALGPRYAGVHLVTHSMGGVVADGALAQGLGVADGLRTYVAIAAPHAGSTFARAGQTVLALADDARDELAEGVRERTGHDLRAAALRDLATATPPAEVPGVTRLHVRIATDALVPRPDARDAGVETRSFLPATYFEGHGASLDDPQTLDAVQRVITSGRAPPDRRAAVLRAAADATDTLTGAAVITLVALGTACLGAYALGLRARRAVRRARADPWRRLALEVACGIFPPLRLLT